MHEPALVIMAAGMGSRFGGLKQITPVDDSGHAIIDFSLFDAYRAGFRKVVFVIKRSIEEDFKATVGRRMEKFFDVKYVFQELSSLPEGYTPPEGRVKPWGTGHAVACCREAVDSPFAVINSDDFYGTSAYRIIYEFLSKKEDEKENAMVGYPLNCTLTENGAVARGICKVKDELLVSIEEQTGLEKAAGGAHCPGENGQERLIPGDTIVSMNFWGFDKRIPALLWAGLPEFLDVCLERNPLKGEYFLPSIAEKMIRSGSGAVRVLKCSEAWHGVTYREDLPSVKASIAKMKQIGIYPDKLWDEFI